MDQLTHSQGNPYQLVPWGALDSSCNASTEHLNVSVVTNPNLEVQSGGVIMTNPGANQRAPVEVPVSDANPGGGQGSQNTGPRHEPPSTNTLGSQSRTHNTANGHTPNHGAGNYQSGSQGQGQGTNGQSGGNTQVPQPRVGGLGRGRAPAGHPDESPDDDDSNDQHYPP